MRRWLFLLGGLLIWAAHFNGVYLIASIADVVASADAPASRLAVAAFTAVCAGGDAMLVFLASRRRAPGVTDESDSELAGFWRVVGGAGALLSLVAVLWQGLPAVIGH